MSTYAVQVIITDLYNSINQGGTWVIIDLDWAEKIEFNSIMLNGIVRRD